MISFRSFLNKGLRWDKTTKGTGQSLSPEHTIIHVNPTHLMRAHKDTSPSFHENMSQGKIDRLKSYVKTGRRVSVATVGAHEGRIGFENGRHRAQLASQMGHKSIPIAVEKDNAPEIHKILRKYTG